MPQNGKTPKPDQKAQQFDTKLSKLKEKVPPFLDSCLTGDHEHDFTETTTKLKELLSEDENKTTGKLFNREINLWQAKFKKKIPPSVKQGLQLKTVWSKCEENLSECAKETKADMMWVLDLMLTCIGEEVQEETEEVSAARAFRPRSFSQA